MISIISKFFRSPQTETFTEQNINLKLNGNREEFIWQHGNPCTETYSQKYYSRSNSTTTMSLDKFPSAIGLKCERGWEGINLWAPPGHKICHAHQKFSQFHAKTAVPQFFIISGNTEELVTANFRHKNPPGQVYHKSVTETNELWNFHKKTVVKYSRTLPSRHIR